jgi:hypothetical protein
MARIETKELSEDLAAFNQIAKQLNELSAEDRARVLKMLNVYFESKAED